MTQTLTVPTHATVKGEIINREAIQICQIRPQKSNTCILTNGSIVTANGYKNNPRTAIWKENLPYGFFRIKSMFSGLYICINKKGLFIARKLLGYSKKCIFYKDSVTKKRYKLLTRIVNLYAHKPFNFNVKGLQNSRQRKQKDHKSLRFLLYYIPDNRIKYFKNMHLKESLTTYVH